MATNADDKATEDQKSEEQKSQQGQVSDEDQTTEDDLRDLKYDEEGVERSKETDEPTEGEAETKDTEEVEEEADDQGAEAESFVKEFPNIKGDTPEEYARNLEKAYQNSTKEALRLKGLQEAPKITSTEDEGEADQKTTTPLELWAQQELNKKITKAYTNFSKEYPQVEEKADYDKFTRRVSALSKTILSDEGRLEEPATLYRMAAASLGWKSEGEPTEKEKLGMALKEKGASSKPGASGAKPSTKSKVTDGMIKASKMMYPGKTDAEIREELEPYIT